MFKIILIRHILTVKSFDNSAWFGIYGLVVNQLNKLTGLFQNYGFFAFLKNIATFELLKDNLSISGLSNLEVFGMRITHSAFARLPGCDRLTSLFSVHMPTTTHRRAGICMWHLRVKFILHVWSAQGLLTLQCIVRCKKCKMPTLYVRCLHSI